VAVVGTGVIGRSWIKLFARAGCRTRVYDPNPLQVENALAWQEEDLKLDVADGFIDAKEAAQHREMVTAHQDLGETLDGAGYLQESGPERIDLKKAMFLELDRTAGPETILGSSTSGLDMTEIARGLPGARRCIIAHPVNPPHVIPAVEVLGGKHTDSGVITRTCEFLTSVGQKPVLMNSYVSGFLLNRMQAALVREAIQLVERGVADVEAVDTVICDGLGLRWALMGPFGVANTNADGGIREYFTRYREAYVEAMNDLASTPSLDSEMIERLGQGTDAMFNCTSHNKIRRWRDRAVGKICAIKRSDPGPCAP
jgi:3-hydroxyacyl-CoA dehydrogenase